MIEIHWAWLPLIFFAGVCYEAWFWVVQLGARTWHYTEDGNGRRRIDR